MQSQISKMEKNQSSFIHGVDLRGRYSVSEFISLMPSQLSWSDQKSIFHLMIFCSQDHPVQFNDSKGIAAIKENIKSALGGLDIFHFPTLVQLWMPKTIGIQQLLVTSDLPFGINLLTEGLCSYRTLCLEHKCDLGCEEELGPVGRVFRNGVPEFSPYVCFYSSKEFKLRDAAVRCGVNGYLALPVFESVRDQCVGVLELITPWDGNYFFADAIGKVIDAFKAVGLRICDAHSPLHKERISRHEFDLSQIEKGLNAFCHAHCIPFAQTWFTSTGENHNESFMCTSEKGSVMLVKKVSSFQKDCIQFGLKKGQSVVWSAFTSGTSCFCKDVKQLSIDEYPLVLSARKVNLTGSFAICLQSRSIENEVYVLEFFLCPYQNFYRKPQTLLNAFLATIQQNFKSFKVASVQEPGADIRLNIIKLDRLDESLEMSATNQSQPLLRFSQNKCENVKTQDNLLVLQNNGDMVKAIGLKVLRNQSRRQLEDAKCISDVTRHEEKQLCRGHSIDRQTNKRKADHSLSCKDVRGFENHNRRTHNRDQARSDLPPATSVSHPAAPTPEIEGTIMIKASFEGHMIKFSLSLSSGIMDFEKEVTKRFNLTAGSFEIKYQKEDNNCILVASDVDLRKLMLDMMSQRKNTVKVLLEPTQNQHLESSRGSVGCPMQQINPVQNESIKAPPAPENEGTIMIKASFEGHMIKFPLSLSSGIMDFEKAVTKRFNLTNGSFEIKYQKEDNNCILVASDVDLRKLMLDMMSQRKNTVKVLLEPTQNQHLECSRGSVGCPMPQINPVQNESIKAPPAPENEGTIMVKASFERHMIKFPLSLSSGIMDFEKAVTKRFNLTAGSFEIKYQKEDNNCILVASDVDLRKLMLDMMSQRKNTVKVLLEPTQNQHLECSRGSVGCPMQQINPVQNESIKAPPAPENEGTIMIKASFEGHMIKFPLSLSSGIMDFEKEVTKRFNLTAGSFEIKYQKEDNNCILVASDVDLRNLMFDMMSQRKNTVKVLLEPTQNQHLESSRGSVGCPMLQINPVQNESIKAPPAPENEGTIMIKASFEGHMIKFPLSLSSGIMDFEKAVTKRFNLMTGSFEIKYQKEDNNCILVASDVDLRKLMLDMMSQRKNTVKVLLESTQNQHLECSRGSVGCPMLQINPVQNESIKAPPAPENEGTIMIKASFEGHMIKFPLSLSSGIMDFEKEVTKRFNLTARSFEIKYQKEDNNCILVASDVDLRKLMFDMMSQRKNTVKVLLEPTQNQHLESSRGSVGWPIPQINPVQNERIMTIKATYKEETVEFQLSLSSKLMDLKKEVMRQFKLSGDSFDIKYLAEPNEWIPFTSSNDLHNCVTIMKPRENSTIRLAVEPCTNQIPEEVATSASPPMAQAMIKQNESFMTIKAKYKEVMIKFQLSLSSGLMQLRDAVKKRFNLCGESYEIKYQDVNNNWIYLSRDADLQSHLRAMRSSDRLTVRLHLEPLNA